MLMKSRCFWEAVKFVEMSACSSDCCSVMGQDMRYLIHRLLKYLQVLQSPKAGCIGQRRPGKILVGSSVEII